MSNLIIERGGGVKLMPVPPDNKKLTASDIQVFNGKGIHSLFIYILLLTSREINKFTNLLDHL